MPEIRTPAAPAAAPVMRAPAAPVAAAPAPVAAAPAPAAPAPTLAASLAPAQASFAGFGGPTLAPATGTVDFQAEEQALMEMAAAVRAELQAAAPAQDVMPEPAMAAPAPAPIAAQAAAVAEAVARAPAAAAPRVNIAPRDVFIPKAAVEPRLDFRMDNDRVEIVAGAEPAPAPVQAAPAPAPAPAAAKPAEGRVSLFGRYRSLTARPKVEEVKAPEPHAKAPTGLNISVGPMDRPVSSHDEDELEIPAFLRRQAN
jgi:cell division protein FtsZ